MTAPHWFKSAGIFFLFAISFAGYAQQRGEYITFELLERITADSLSVQVQQQTGFPGAFLGVTYNVKIYRVAYYTLDYQSDSLTIATGIVAIPDNYPCPELGILTFGHGLAIKDWEAPSNNDNAYALIAKGMGSNGVIGAAPDYIHLGPHASPGFQAFMHAETEATATVDLIRAIRSFCVANNIGLTGQIFLAGYSQGGHSSLATAKEMQQNLAGEFTVTACASGGGTYDLSGIAADSLASNTRVTPEPHAMCLIIRSYLEIYKDSLPGYGLPADPALAFDSIFRHPYDSLLALMLQRDNNYYFPLDSIPVRMLEDTFRILFQADSSFYFRKLLALNDLYNWSPQMPLLLFQSTSDIEDPIANTYFTLAQFQQMGAPNVQMETVDNMTHPQAAIPYILFAKSFLLNLRNDCLTAIAPDEKSIPVNIYPNPASGTLYIDADESFKNGHLRLYNARLQTVYSSVFTDKSIDISGLPAGQYMIELRNTEGRAVYKLMMKGSSGR